jgi:hypothetical protein
LVLLVLTRRRNQQQQRQKQIPFGDDKQKNMGSFALEDDKREPEAFP